MAPRWGSLPYFIELGRGMGWSAATVLSMVWIYWDESGEHGPGGTLRRLTLGCGVATFSAWEALSYEWSSALERVSVPMFHMADFEARKPPYDKWDNAKRRAVLKELLDIASRHVPVFWGYSGNARDLVGKHAFKSAYQANLIKAFKEIVVTRSAWGAEPITMVFAKHKEISAEWLGRLFDHFSYWLGDKVRFGGFGDPLDICPLQVADIAAYEFSRTAREKRPENERYPLLTLASRAEVFTLYHASQLGRDVSVWGRPVTDFARPSKTRARKPLASRPPLPRGPSR